MTYTMDNSNKNNSDKIWQYTKGIRFKAESQGEIQNSHLKHQQGGKADIAEFAQDSQQFVKDFKTFIFYKNEKTGQQGLVSKIDINKSWLKLFCGQNFYEKTRHSGKGKGSGYSLKDVSFLQEKLNEWIKDWSKAVKTLSDLNDKPDESQNRRSDMALQIQMLKSHRMLNFMSQFLESINHKEEQQSLNQLKDRFSKIEEAVKALEQEFLPSQGAGVLVARASMNYYTVSKKPKEYKKYQEDLENQLEGKTYAIKKEQDGYAWYDKGKKFFTFKSKQEKEWLRRSLSGINGSLKDETKLTIQETYEMMKEFKAEQKAVFYEIIRKIANNERSEYEIKNENFLLKGFKIPATDFKDWEALNKTFSLFQFKNEEDYKKFTDLDKEIQRLATKKNQSGNPDEKKRLASQITKKKKEKGKYLFGKNCYFKVYGEFCESFKTIAMKLGKLKAQIKGIEKERLEAVNTQFWSLIFEEIKQEKTERFLWLIPKETADFQEAKKFLDNLEGDKVQNPIGHVRYFKSLTMRALHKLCFAEESTFVKDMQKEDRSLHSMFKAAKEFKTDGDKQKLEQRREKELKALQAVLKSNYAQKHLDLEDFDLSKVTLDEFEIELEKACYVVKKIPFNEQNKSYFLKEFDVSVFKLTSYDLEGKNKTSQERAHTRLWRKFWEKGEAEKIRLNPEIQIRFRKADDGIKAFLQKNKFDLKKDEFHHRRLQDQYTAHLTFALNAGAKHPELAFMKPEELRKKINDFNDDFNKRQDFEDLWKFGIDRGNIELATLCIAKFKKEEIYQYKDKKFPKPTFPVGEEEIKCLELKPEYLTHREKAKPTDEREKEVIANLSYFMDRKDWFEEKSCTCIDLTTAKVIKGQIVLNGDIRTYLKLKKENAKRKIYDLFHAGKIEPDEILHWIETEESDGLLVPSSIQDENVLKQQEKPENYGLYFHSDKFETILAKEADECFADHGKEFFDSEKLTKDEQQFFGCDFEKMTTEQKAKYRIRQNLEYYLDELRKLKDSREGDKSKSQEARKANEHTPTIDKLNALRDSITANMIGVIFHLQKQYPGIVILEDLNKGTLDRHFNEHNENISRRLEMKLYQKFQTLGQVPPHLKDVIEIREAVREEYRSKIEKKPKDYQELSKRKQGKTDREIKKTLGEFTMQLGAIVFTSEFETSGKCPYCENPWVWDKNNNEEGLTIKKLKFQQQRYLCGKHKKMCGFDTKKLNSSDMLAEINDPDKVAAYNVAKKIQKPKDIQKLPEPKIKKEEGTNGGNDSPKKTNNHQQPSSKSQKKKEEKPINPDSPFAAMKDLVK